MAAGLVLLVVATLIFLFVRLVPGDPAVALLGSGATNAQIQALRQQLGLDRTLPEQFATYLGGLLRGDLGASLRTNRPVAQELLQRLPATIELTVAALVSAIVVGIPIGLWSAYAANRLADHVIRIVSLVAVSAPVFWLALFAQVIFSVQLNLLPVSARLDPLLKAPAGTGFLLIDALAAGDMQVFGSALSHLVLPAGVLAAYLAAVIARMVRASTISEIRQDYARTARAKGLSRLGMVLKHALPNALLPAITLIGLKVAELLGGAILTETVFSWPGIGRYMFEAITNRDYPVIQGATLLFASGFILSSMAVDALYGALNPRIRAGRG